MEISIWRILHLESLAFTSFRSRARCCPLAHSCALMRTSFSNERITSSSHRWQERSSILRSLISIQHHLYKYLDNQDCKAVRIFTVDFRTAFDSVNTFYSLQKLSQLPLNPYKVNTVEPRYNNPRYNDIPGITKVKCMGQNPDVTMSF